MDEQRFIIPAPTDQTFQPVDTPPLELARSRQVQGRLFEKHILNLGPLIHPKTGDVINVDKPFVAAMQQNFAKGVCDIVQVPLANDANEHVEGPAANLGEVMGIKERGGKVYALIDARQDPDKFGKTYLGASAFLSTNYTDSATGKKAGPTLLHVAVTNRPYVTGLEDYKEVLAASADNSGEVVVLTPPEETEVPLTKEELLAKLKDDHGIDVEALQMAANASNGPDMAALTAGVVEALQTSGVQLSSVTPGADGTVEMSTVTDAVLELAGTVRNQAADIAGLRRERAEAEVNGYIDAGRLLPKSRTVAVEMALTNRDQLEAIVAPADRPYVALAAQKGVDGPDGAQRQETDIDAEVARLTAEHAEMFSPNGTKK
jgi:hypothetical protein